MVLKIPFGFRKLTKAEARSGQYGPKGLRICKLPEWTPNIMEMRRRVLKSDPYVAIVAWLIATGTPVGPVRQGGEMDCECPGEPSAQSSAAGAA